MESDSSSTSVLIKFGIIGLCLLTLVGIFTYLAIRYFNRIKESQNPQGNQTSMIRTHDCESLEQILYTISDDDFEEIGHFPEKN